MPVKSICGVILISESPEELAEFYSKALNLKFEKEDHGGLDIHFGTDIGQIHFGIHPSSNFKLVPVSHSSVIAFDVEDFEETTNKLKKLGAEELIPPHNEGFGNTTTYKDPEGNLLEVVQMEYEFGKEH